MNTEFILYTSILIIVAVVGLYSARLFTRFYKAKKERQYKDISQVSFVVDTFHDLVAQLKEKEKELEILKQDAEDRASDIEGYNENILQSVPSGVISFDEGMKITKVNRSAEKILEIQGESVIGKSHTEVLNSPISDFLINKKVIERGEISYITPSGKKIWLGLTLSPLRNKDNMTIGQILVFTDLTHLKAIESQMSLRDKLSSLGEISAGIAHELRNPMGVIAGYTNLLSKKVDGALKPAVVAISNEISVMDRIISDFLSFARPAELNLSNVDLKTTIENCISSVIGERKDIHLRLVFDELPFFKGDEVILRQALINLIQNAVDAMPHGGTLSIKASKGESLEITISDTGHGISEDIRNKIFMPFYTTKEKGTGLGLAIVHKTVISHGGQISFQSTEKGTIFTIRLPLNPINLSDK